MENPVLKAYIDIMNQIFDIEKKAMALNESNSIQRNLNRLKEIMENDLPLNAKAGLIYHNPIGEAYNETRTDCEATIAGNSTEDLVISEVIRPIIRLKEGGFTHIIQKAVVITESKVKSKK